MHRLAVAVTLTALFLLGLALLPLRYPEKNFGWPTFELRRGEKPVVPLGQDALRWDLRFSDEFDGEILDREVWATCFWWDDNGCTNLSTNEQQWYVPEQVTVSEGVLHLTADHGPVVGFDDAVFPYVSGMVSSGRPTNDKEPDPGYAFQFGYVEMRARIPAGAGLWPAFWLLPITHDSKPEIDILEFLGQDPHLFRSHIHWRNETGESRSEGNRWRGPNFADGWHTFAVEWSEDAVIWFVDGRQVWSFHEADHLPAEPMYLIANLAVGGEYAGPTDGTDFPAEFAVDYIRVWQEATPSG